MNKEENTMIVNLAKKTGKPLEEWINIVKKAGLSGHKEIIDHLKNNYGFTYGYANLVSVKARGTDAGSAGSDKELIDAQYAGDKSVLKPIYDRLIDQVNNFGADIEIAPKKAYVSVRRKKQFAIIQPSTKTRVDVGINLKGAPPQGKLEASGSFNSMVSHRVKITDAGEVDQSLIDWLKAAYEQAG